MDGYCNVPGCTKETFTGWQPTNERLGRKVCEYHWRRHKDPADSFNLWDAFGFRKPAAIEKPTSPKKDVPRCACGRERLAGRKFCTECAAERERQRKKEAYHERKSRPQQEPVEARPILGCRACGAEREAGHTYCPSCGREREKQSARERQKRRYRKMQKPHVFVSEMI